MKLKATNQIQKIILIQILSYTSITVYPSNYVYSIITPKHL